MARAARESSKAAAKAAKKDEKNKERLEKLHRRNEAIFDKALSKFTSTALESERQFVLKSLEDNPKWIAPLSNLIRHGALNGLLRLDATGEPEDDPNQWRGKATKWVQLPDTVKLTMLKAVGVKLPAADISEDWLGKAFQSNFFVGHGVPLPKDPNIRQLQVMEAYARERQVALGFEFLDQTPLCPEEDLNLWSLAGNTLTCKVNDEETTLPQLPGKQGWKLIDPCDPECLVVPDDETPSGPFQFACHTFFDIFDKVKPNAKWPALEAVSP